ncbi:MAG: hypothetical protein VW684_05205, partial [Betaproteobacteria bacterium]
MDAMAIAGPIDRISTNRASEMSGVSSLSFLDEGHSGNRFTQSLLEANQKQSLSHEKQLLKDHSGRAAPQSNRASGAETTSEDDAVTASNTRGPGALEMPSSTMKQGNNGKSLPAQDRQDLPLEGRANSDRAITELGSASSLAPQTAISSDVDRAEGSMAQFAGGLSVSNERPPESVVVDSRSVLVGQGVVGQLGAGALSENMHDATSSKRSNTEGDAIVALKATESQRLSANSIAEERGDVLGVAAHTSRNGAARDLNLTTFTPIENSDQLAEQSGVRALSAKAGQDLNSVEPKQAGERDHLSGALGARAASAKIGDGIMTTQAAPQV